MTLQYFLSTHDNKNAIILLEGKRTVPADDREKLQRLGYLLARKSMNMMFRSGNADGADYYFSLGVAAINPARLQVITPNSSHRKSKLLTTNVIALDQLDITKEHDVVEQSLLNKKTIGLVKQYIDGRRDWLTQKAAYIIRDTIKVIGTSGVPPATFGIFYDDLEDLNTGGTGHTMNVCRENNVQFIDQRMWLGWLDEK